MKGIKLPLLLLIVAISLNACGQVSFDEKMEQLYHGTVPLIKPKDLSKLDPQQVVLLDIRSEKEYKVSHISNARFIDYDGFKSEDVQGISKESKIVVYCAIGVRSERVGEQLLELGFKDVSNLYGGIFGWKNEGLPVIDENKQPTERVHTYNKNWSKWLQKGEKVYE
ncbi:MAG: rhodanese-like domain-containing protein [Cyclobacteriaceae bacterium]